MLLAAHRRHWLAHTSVAAILLVAAPAAAQQADGTNDESGIVRLKAIEVTANKRTEPLAEVDGTVTVRTAEQLEQARVTKVSDLDKVFPGLIIRTRGNQAYSNVSIRGVTSSDFYNPAVQIYVDGVPQDAAYFTQDLVNVERVELLRGPQGTLYGRNAHGGVINVITRKPGEAHEGLVATSISTGETSAEGRISGPLVPGKLFADLNLRAGYTQGRVDDIATGEDGIDDSRSKVARLRLRYAPDDSPLDVMITAQREELYSHEEIYLRSALFDDLEYDSSTQGGAGLLDREVTTYALSAEYDFGSAALSSTTSYQDRDMARTISRDTPEDQDTVSEELRLSFGSGPFDGVVGAYFQNTEFERRVEGYPGYSGDSTNQVTTQSYALFGETTYAVTPTVDVTGGLRWSREEAEIDFVQEAPNGFDFAAEDSFDNISPKLAVGWQVHPGHRLYAVASRGFKPGGFNHTVSNSGDQIPYDSETSTNLELGWRGALLGGKVQGGAAGYWIYAEDKQIYTGVVPNQVLSNVGDSESFGVELDMLVQPTSAVSLSFGLTVGRSEFRDATDPSSGADYSGNALPYAPDVTGMVGARWVVPQTYLPGALSLNGSGRFFSKTYFDEANTLSESAIAIFDASVDLALDSGFSVSLFAENMTDEVYATSSFQFGTDDVRSTRSEGRIVGLTGRYAF